MLNERQIEMVLRYHHKDKLSVRGISALTGIPKSTVWDIISRSRDQKVSEGLDDYDYSSVNVVNVKPEQKVAKRITGVGPKRVLVLSDLHCGHKFGLTPPDWFVPGTGPDYMSYQRAAQQETWDFYTETLRSVGDVDILIVVGDAVDGKATRSGGTEQLTCSMAEQRDIAETCLRAVDADKIFMVHGTPYHTASDGEDNETLISERLGAVVEDHLWLDVNGIVFDVKHKIGGSSIPHGRATAISKEYVWNRQWAEIQGQPKADVFLRGHVHYHTFVGSSEYLAMTLPALQMPNTKFGARQCSGTVDFGMVYFDIPEKIDSVGDIEWKSIMKRIKSVAPKVLKG